MFITVVGSHHKEIAKALCEMYDTTLVERELCTDVNLTDKLEKDICIDEEKLEETCRDIAGYLHAHSCGYNPTPEDFEF